MSGAAAALWCVVSFIAGWKLCAHVMTYRFAWRECCLKHYQTHEEEE